MYGWSDTIFSVYSIILIALIILSWFLLRCFRIKNFGWVFAVAHFLFITLFAVMHYQYRYDGQAEFVWFIPYQYDIPISLLWLKIFAEIGSMFPVPYIYKSMLGSYVFFGLFGSIQYYIIGRIIGLLVSKLKNEKK